MGSLPAPTWNLPERKREQHMAAGLDVPSATTTWTLRRHDERMVCTLQAVSDAWLLRMTYNGLRFMDLYCHQASEAIVRSTQACRILQMRGWRHVDRLRPPLLPTELEPRRSSAQRGTSPAAIETARCPRAAGRPSLHATHHARC